uniref:Peptidase S1 domain-containing protein n=1 Tax=Romanomermis culicivorax TaxID=13658 RepID=A0A915KZD5_ROMCU
MKKQVKPETGKTYFAGNVAPKTAHALGQCANATIFHDFTIIEKWIVSDSTVCFFDGKFYKHLAEVKSGCRRKCLCRQGVIECANQCQEDEIQADKLVVCRSMNALGECCPKTECQRNSSDFLNVVKCQDPKVILPANENRQEMTVPPWSYFIVVNRYSTNNAATWCGATLVDEKWVLTPAHCLYTADSPDSHFVLSTPNFVEIYKPDAEAASVNLVGRTTASKILRLRVHPNYQRPGDESLSKSRSYSSFDFAMLELDPPIRPSPHEQPINLPWTSECYQFVDNARCKVSSTNPNGSGKSEKKSRECELFIFA